MQPLNLKVGFPCSSCPRTRALCSLPACHTNRGFQGPRHAPRPARRPTRKPVGPAQPEAERVQRQRVDEVHEQMDQALHGDH